MKLNKPTLILNHGCHPCNTLKSAIKASGKDMSGYKVKTLSSQLERNMMERAFEITGYPVVLIPDGKPITGIFRIAKHLGIDL